MYEFDRILDKVGHLGRYQLLICAFVFWLGVLAGLHNIASVFYAAYVPYRCNVPPIDNNTLYPNLTQSDILNYTTPFDGENYDTCKRYGYNLSACDPPSTTCVDMSAPPINCDLGYHFDTFEFTSTVNMERNFSASLQSDWLLRRCDLDSPWLHDSKSLVDREVHFFPSLHRQCWKAN